jgi:hypothetical protein
MTQLTKKESMTSLELLKEINIFREKEGKETEMQHKTLLVIIRDEFEEEISQQELLLSNYYSRGKEFPMFILTLAQSKQVLSRESKFVRKAVLKYIENLEQKLQKSLSVEETIIKQAESMMQVKNDIQRLENKFDTVVTLESGKQRKIQIEIASRVYKLLPEPQPDLDNKTVKEITRRIFSNIHRDIKRKFGVASYKDIKVVEYEKAIDFINSWIEDSKEVI